MGFSHFCSRGPGTTLRRLRLFFLYPARLPCGRSAQFFILLSVFSLPAPAQTLAAKRNLILITLDTVRADRMGFLGSRRGLTPNLDALARDSVAFRNAFAQVPLTTPSHATILTGAYPQFHGVADFGSPLSAKTTPLAEMLRAGGYHTAAFVGSIVLDPHSGLAPGFERGFDSFDAGYRLRRPPLEDRYETIERRAGEVISRASDWLSKNPQGPFFIWIHLYDPHDPYDPPAPFSRRFARAPYDGEIAYTDSSLGTLFQFLKSRALYQESLIVVIGDHGEALGAHGESTHGVFLYDETIRVPFLLKLPGNQFAGKFVAAPVELVDFAPTALAVLGFTPPATFQGISLLGIVEGKSAGRAWAYSETEYPSRAFGWSALAALRTGRYLFVLAPRPELYDLSSDPQSRVNLASENSATASQLRSELESLRALYRSQENPAARSALGAEELEKLRSLGYVGYAGPTHAAGALKADPKDKIKIANEVHEAILAGENGRFRDAIELFRSVVEADPGIYTAQYQLGLNLNRAKRYGEAVTPLERAVQLRPDAPHVIYQLGLALFHTGKLKESTMSFERAVGLVPTWAEAHYSLASVYARVDRVPDAERELHRSLELNPNLFNAHLLLGRILTLQGRADEGVANLERAIRLDPTNAEGHAFLADAYARLGRDADANRERARAERLSHP